MTKNLTCIVCPMGCALTVTSADNKTFTVTGNTCPRGEEYAKNECTNPQRTVTSTVRTKEGALVAVKTDRAIAKDKVFACMRAINLATPALPIAIGDVIIKDVFGANVVATQNMRLE